jgi:hypothetical protein
VLLEKKSWGQSYTGVIERAAAILPQEKRAIGFRLDEKMKKAGVENLGKRDAIKCCVLTFGDKRETCSVWQAALSSYL